MTLFIEADSAAPAPISANLSWFCHWKFVQSQSAVAAPLLTDAFSTLSQPHVTAETSARHCRRYYPTLNSRHAFARQRLAAVAAAAAGAVALRVFSCANN